MTIALDKIEVDPDLGYKVHPFADGFPMMEGAEFDELVEDIRKNGLREPIEHIKHDGDKVIIDGRNRLKACRVAGVDPDFAPWPGESDEALLAYIWSKNIHRRQLSASQRAMLVTEHQGFIDAITGSNAQRRKATQGRPKKGAKKTEGNIAPSKKTAGVVADAANVSERTAKDALAVQKSGDKELIEDVKSGKKSASAAAKTVREKAKKTTATKSAPKKKTAATKAKPTDTQADTQAVDADKLRDVLDVLRAGHNRLKRDQERLEELLGADHSFARDHQEAFEAHGKVLDQAENLQERESNREEQAA